MVKHFGYNIKLMNPDADTIIYQDQGKSQHAFLNLYILQATPAVLSKV